MASRWVPQQHGAWAMLAVPVGAGLLLRVRAGSGLPLFLLALIAFWICGYFAFYTASVWLKAAPARRPALRRPALTYAAASSALGLATLAAAGATILPWALAFVPLLVPALWLAARRRERATLGGALTTAAASLMALVVTHPEPASLLRTDASARAAIVAASACFAYFFGTVLYVKTNIRERGSQRFYAASLGWHAAATLAAILLGASGAGPWAWTPFFALATARAAWVPRRRPPFSPKQIGLAEVAFCVALLAIVAAA